jgi:hypothetical protein
MSWRGVSTLRCWSKECNLPKVDPKACARGCHVGPPPPAQEPRLIPGRDASCPGRSTRYPDPVSWYPSRPSFEPYERGPCPAQHLRLHSTCLPFLHRPSFLPLRAPRSPAVRIRLSFFPLHLCAVCSIWQLAACLRPHCPGIWKFLQSFVALEVIGRLGGQLVCRLLHSFWHQPLHRSFCISFRNVIRFAVLFVVFLWSDLGFCCALGTAGEARVSCNVGRGLVYWSFFFVFLYFWNVSGV